MTASRCGQRQCKTNSSDQCSGFPLSTVVHLDDSQHGSYLAAYTYGTCRRHYQKSAVLPSVRQLSILGQYYQDSISIRINNHWPVLEINFLTRILTFQRWGPARSPAKRRLKPIHVKWSGLVFKVSDLHSLR